MIFPISKVKYKIIREVYEEKKIHISNLFKKINISPKSGYRYISELILSGIIREELEGKKPTLRFLLPDFSETGKICFALVEEEKKKIFLVKHKELKGPFEQFVKEIRVGTALIFGSFARGGETKNSDIDIILIGKKIDKKKIDKISERCFITVRNPVSIRIFKEKDFLNLLKKKEAFALQAEKEHVIISNSLGWMDLVAKIF